MFDIGTDTHGCIDELTLLLAKLGYVETGGVYSHPRGRKFVQCGDMVDRGPNSVAVLKLIMTMSKAGNCLTITGNHDDKLRRALKPGSKVKPNHGLDVTLKQIESEPESFRAELATWLEALPYQLTLDSGKLLIAHAGLPEKMHGVDNGKVRSHALYGDVNGQTDPDGFPIRKDWTKDYSGSRIVVHGHVPVLTPDIRNKVYNLDTGCCFNGHLTALRYPEMEIVQVKSKANYSGIIKFGSDTA